MIYHLGRALFALFFFLFYRIRSYGQHNVLKSGALFTPNHASYFDGIILQLTQKEPVYQFVKESLFRTRISNAILRAVHCIPVGRGRENIGMIKEASRLVSAGRKLAIYPEGARSPDGSMHPGLRGVGMLVCQLGVPAIPVYIGNTFEIYNRKMLFPRLFKTIPCVFGQPIYFDDLIEDESIPRKEAYKHAVDRIMNRIALLKIWYDNGCIGDIP